MKYKVTLNNKVYEVEVEEGDAMLLNEYEAAAPAPAPAAPAAAAGPAAYFTPGAPAVKPGEPVQAASIESGEQVCAPLPGNVLSVNVSVGDTVKSGQLLLVIEAMKMENEVLAPADGKVVQILVSKGSVVATGDVLVVI